MISAKLALLGLAVCINFVQGEMDLVLLPASTVGGKCNDGSSAAYYVRKGTDSSLFVIYMEGGGSCHDEPSCARRCKSKPNWCSSKAYANTKKGDKFLDVRCTQNPGFCNATAVYLPYCSSDGRRGTQTAITNKSFGLYFSGHMNFVAIVNELKTKYGMGTAKKVMLSGASAGAIGTLYNVDWLAEQLPTATVKAAPVSGWFFPAALPDDPTTDGTPSDYQHFSDGTHGNAFNIKEANAVYGDEGLYGFKKLIAPACIEAQKPGEWWRCMTMDTYYKFIKSPLFIIENQYDANQVFLWRSAPTTLANATEGATLDRYIAMYGEAMRNSTAQILHHVPASKKMQTVPDGLFMYSCLMHMMPEGAIQGQTWIPIVGDWFHELGELKAYYNLVESCPASANGLPCHKYEKTSKSCVPGSKDMGGGRACCQAPSFAPSPSPGPGPGPSGACIAQLKTDGCLAAVTARACDQCAKRHSSDLDKAGCTREAVIQACKGVGLR